MKAFFESSNLLSIGILSLSKLAQAITGPEEPLPTSSIPTTCLSNGQN